MIEDSTEAERLARAILDDITLDHPDRVQNTRDLLADLAPEIDEGRALFRARVAPALHHVYEDELLPWRGTARDHAKKLGRAPLDRTRLLLAIGAAVALVAVIVWLVTR